MDTVRIDRWLCAARLYKTRALSQQACTGGLVKLNGEHVKPAHLVRRGDEVRAESARGLVIWQVRGLAEKRLSAALASTLYDDHSPPPAPREEVLAVAARSRGTGRPTKADRRALDRLREI